MSWATVPGGYALAMNRDERRTRARGTPPLRIVLREVPVLMPVDPDAGGSWVTVNAQGMSLALLNSYEESPEDPGGTFTSRGLLVRELAWAEHPGQVARELEAMPLADYRPFILACLAAGAAPHVFEWDGRRLDPSTVPEPGLVRASSGSDQAEAERVRGGLFRAASGEPGGLTAATLERLHRSHLPQRGPISICMHRKEAHTVSLSLITVTEKIRSIFYVDGSPGEITQGTLHSL